MREGLWEAEVLGLAELDAETLPVALCETVAVEWDRLGDWKLSVAVPALAVNEYDTVGLAELLPVGD